MAQEPVRRHDALARLCAGLGIEGPSAHLEEALTHPSFTNEQPDAGAHNQRLEFLGDAVLAVCVSEMLMEAFGDAGEGELTVMRAALVNTESLAARARDLGIAAALRVGRGADAAGERHRPGVLADALEAVLGAVFVDFGLDAARAVSRRVLAGPIAALLDAGGMERDPKSRLQELVQARGLGTPRYRVVEERGPPHDRTFAVEVEVQLGALPAGPPDRMTACGEGRSKKLAEQEAARVALATLLRR
jgi:ribonuclease-3